MASQIVNQADRESDRDSQIVNQANRHRFGLDVDAERDMASPTDWLRQTFVTF